MMRFIKKLKVSGQWSMVNGQQGFTLLELLIVIALIVILAMISTGVYRNFSKGVELDGAARGITSDLRDARSRAMGGKDDLKWGIHAVSNSTSSYYVLFSTATDYSAASTTITTYLQSTVAFSSPAVGSTADIIFSKVSGNTTSTTLIIISESSTRTITVSTSGTIY